MSTVQDPRKTWLATGSLLAVWWRMQSLVPRLPLAFWLWLSPAYLSASGGGEGPVRSQLALLWYPLSPLFCERVRLCLRAFHGKFLSLSLSLSLSLFSLSGYPSLGCYLTLSSDCPQSSLRLSSGHSGLVLTLSMQPKPPSLFSPRLLLVDESVWATSPLGVAIRCVICGVFFFFSSRLCCPLRFQNSPQTCQ